jgi:UDP:flavonoid glycosyltransferase YjiC (YdhE family)
MRVLITTLPGHGHLGPLIPLAHALRTAGHEVAFGTSATFREFLAARGLALEPCGPHWRESDFGYQFQQPHVLADLGRFIDTEVTSRVLADVEGIVRRWQPDVLLSNDYEPNGRVVAERAGIPFVLASSGPRVTRATQEKLLGFNLKRSRAAGGLPQHDELSYSLEWLRLQFCPAFHCYCAAGEAEPIEAPNQYAIRPSVDARTATRSRTGSAATSGS